MNTTQKLDLSGGCAMRIAMLLLLIGSCTLISGCSDSAVIWSANAKSPNGNWVASAKTEQFGGPGTAGVYTSIYLKMVHGSHAPTEIVNLSNESAYPIGVTAVTLNWATSSHLDIAYKGRVTIEFQAIKVAGIDITVHPLIK